MKYRFSGVSRRSVCTTLLGGMVFAASAQPAGMLYDPEPPSDSAYVRVIHASRDGAIEVTVDGKSRIKKLGAGESSEYLVLGAGKRSIVVYPFGQKKALLSTTIDVVSGQPMTVAITAMLPDSVPIIFKDKANTNKLKALLTVYHIDPKSGKLDVLSADRSTKVFSSVSYGSSASIQVNPIAIDLIATKANDSVPVGDASLTMTQGGNYSIVLLSGGGKITAMHAIQNKTERYTGK